MSQKEQRTIKERKRRFIQNEIDFLSSSFEVTDKMEKIADEAGLGYSKLQKAVGAVNRNLSKHTKHAYHPLRIERVVERVDAFYWDASAVPASESSANAESVNGEATDSETDFLGDDSKLYQCDDLTEDRFIKRLPHNWDTRDEDEFSRDHTPTDQTSYFAAVKRLQDLSQRRHELQLKKNTYRALLSSLEAYRQPIESIQPNLVWKEAPLAPELMKTRALAYRVLGRVEERFEDVEVSATEEDEDVIMVDDDKQKVNEVLAAWS